MLRARFGAMCPNGDNDIHNLMGARKRERAENICQCHRRHVADNRTARGAIHPFAQVVMLKNKHTRVQTPAHTSPCIRTYMFHNYLLVRHKEELLAVTIITLSNKYVFLLCEYMYTSSNMYIFKKISLWTVLAGPMARAVEVGPMQRAVKVGRTRKLVEVQIITFSKESVSMYSDKSNNDINKEMNKET